MPDLSKLVRMSSPNLIRCPNKKPAAAENFDLGDSNSANTETPLPIHNERNGDVENRNSVLRLRIKITKPVGPKSFDDHLKEWLSKKVELGVPGSKSFLPFLVDAPKLSQCRVCENVIYPEEKVPCSVGGCQGSYHLTCARDSLGLSPPSKEFKCPQHACFLCKMNTKNLWRCSICHLASHDKCAAYPEHVFRSYNHSAQIICWRHTTDWPSIEPAAPTDSIEGLFCRLPLPYMAEEFKVDPAWKNMVNNKLEPAPYVHIKHNIYFIKKKRERMDGSGGCMGCDSNICLEKCMCRLQSISCSKACWCSEMCTNRPFRKEKKTKVVMTKRCGWGLEAAEPIKKGDFIIEYVGEVIGDDICDKRFREMNNEGATNFYMCEVRKNFTIDATFKGNASRFMNHSCDPNCNLEKWEVEGETRLGIFAAKSIEVGEALTYHYRFVQFGPQVKCRCGSPNCQRYLGVTKKTSKLEMQDWGVKRRRTAAN